MSMNSIDKFDETCHELMKLLMYCVSVEIDKDDIFTFQMPRSKNHKIKEFDIAKRLEKLKVEDKTQNIIYDEFEEIEIPKIGTMIVVSWGGFLSCSGGCIYNYRLAKMFPVKLRKSPILHEAIRMCEMKGRINMLYCESASHGESSNIVSNETPHYVCCIDLVKFHEVKKQMFEIIEKYPGLERPEIKDIITWDTFVKLTKK